MRGRTRRNAKAKSNDQSERELLGQWFSTPTYASSGSVGTRNAPLLNNRVEGPQTRNPCKSD